MLQRILGVVLVIAGLGVIAFGVASATVLKESDTVVATARPTGDGTVVVTDPGVLGMVAAEVTVTATVPAGQQVTLVAGRDVDVLGWLGDDAYTRVTGMTDWETLSTEAVAAAEPEGEDAEAEAEEPAEPELLDPRGSDMWVTELTEEQEVSLRWTGRSGPWMVMAAGTGAAPVEDEDAEAADDAEATEDEAAAPQAPTLQLTWSREAATPLLWPAVGGGAVLLLIGLALLGAARRRTRGARREPDAADLGSSSAASAVTSASSARSADDAPRDEATSPFAPTTAAGVGRGTWPGTTASPAPAPVPAPAPAAAPAPAPAAAQTDSEANAGQDGDGTAEEGSGTAPVPVAGRFSRRSLLGRGRTPAAPEQDAAAAQQANAADSQTPAPAPASLPAPPPAADEPAPAPADRPLTRRELRLREEERRASQSSGRGRMLRALTGQTPVVPQPAPEATAEPDEAPSAPRRASTWRETWGFDAGNGAPGADETTDERNR